MRYTLYASDGKKVASTLHPIEEALTLAITDESSIIKINKSRGGKLKSNNGSVIFAYTDDIDLVNSSMKFKKVARAILNSIDYINEAINNGISENNKSVKRLTHNLTSLNGDSIQEIHLLLPQEVISRKMKDQVEYARDIISKNPSKAAKTFIRIAKNNAAMKTEFSVFKMLFEAKPSLRPALHVMHRVLLNVLYLFFPDFTDKMVHVIVTQSEAAAYFDYESLHVALYHMIDNAAKYTKTDSRFNISIVSDAQYLTLKFFMCSIKILEAEREKIFDEGFSGSTAVAMERSGSGVGMSLVRKIIESNGGTIIANPHENSEIVDGGFLYQDNEFIMRLPIKKIISV